MPILSNINHAGEKFCFSSNWLSKKLQTSIAPIFTKTLAISIVACKVFGSSKSLTIRRKEGCCFVLSRLISFVVNEKKATSQPAIKKDNTKSSTAKKSIMPVVAGFRMFKKVKSILASNTEW